VDGYPVRVLNIMAGNYQNSERVEAADGEVRGDEKG
jgi:hypothetical protein